jgi:hypothetical protein
VDKTNEIQVLGRAGDSITLTKSSVKVSVNDADSDPANELQTLNLNAHNLSISDDPGSTVVDLSAYLDDTDTDDQVLSKDGYDLTIQDGNTISIRPDIIAFKAFTVGSGTVSLPAGQHNLIFEIEKLDSLGVYNENTGEFVVPTGGDGLYRFDLFYNYSNNQTVGLYINDVLYEQAIFLGTYCNYPFLVYLTQGSSVRIKLTTSISLFPLSGFFSGYRIN